jgi:hypothetical protein
MAKDETKKNSELKDSYTWEEIVGNKKGKDAYEEFCRRQDIMEALEKDEIEAWEEAKRTVVR